MGILSSDAYEVQNPALVAVMQWRFTLAYETARSTGEGPPLHLAFLVAPLVLQPESLALVSGTQKGSGLRVFVEKFSRSAENKSDLRLALNERTRILLGLSMRALQLAVSAGFITVRKESGQLLALSRAEPRLPREETRRLLAASHRLGLWMGELSLHEALSALKVRL